MLPDFLDILRDCNVDDAEVKKIEALVPELGPETIDLAEFFHNTVMPLLPKFIKSQDERGAARSANHNGLITLLSLGFAGHLPSKDLNDIWSQIEEQNRMYFAIADAYPELPVLMAARAGNFEGLTFLNLSQTNYSSANTSEKQTYNDPLKDALLAAGKNGHVKCVHFMLHMLAKFSKAGTGKELLIRVQLTSDSPASGKPLSEILGYCYAQFLAQSELGNEDEKKKAKHTINAFHFFLKGRNLSDAYIAILKAKVLAYLPDTIDKSFVSLDGIKTATAVDIQPGPFVSQTIQLVMTAPADEEASEAELSETARTSTEESEDKSAADVSSMTPKKEDEDEFFDAITASMTKVEIVLKPERPPHAKPDTNSDAENASSAGSDDDGSGSDNANAEELSDLAILFAAEKEPAKVAADAPPALSSTPATATADAPAPKTPVSTPNTPSSEAADDEESFEDDEDAALNRLEEIEQQMLVPLEEIDISPLQAPPAKPAFNYRAIPDARNRIVAQDKLDDLIIALDKSKLPADKRLRREITSIVDSFNDPSTKDAALERLDTAQKVYYSATEKSTATKVGLAFAAFVIAATTAFVVAASIAVAAFLITSPTGPASIFFAFGAFVSALPLGANIGIGVAAFVTGAIVCKYAGIGLFKKSPERKEIDDALIYFTAAVHNPGSP